MDVSFDTPFYEQVGKLQSRVPIYATSTSYSTIENSPYINRATALKNCHLCFNANNSENMLYCRALTNCYGCVDCFDIVDCEHGYELVGCQRCTTSQYLSYCRDCDECFFGRDLSNCQYCFGCVNLSGKKYHFNNEPLSKSEYFHDSKMSDPTGLQSKFLLALCNTKKNIHCDTCKGTKMNP